MVNPNSPFYIVQDFISPLLCEQMVDMLDMIEPDLDKDQNPQLTIKSNDVLEKVIYDYVQGAMPQIEQHYNVEYRGMKPVEFKWYPEDFEGENEFTCENATYNSNKNWVKNKDRDLTGIIFLSDYNNKIPFETEYEVYGGKLEYPQHQFGFQAERGTLIMYPSGPHFLNQVRPVVAGDLFMAKFHIATQLPFIYDPILYPGDFTTWFESIS